MIYIWSLIVGLVLGAIFALLKLPVPAPSTLAGVVGIAGVTLGYLLVTHTGPFPTIW